ncbi:M28 family peptidase [Nitrospira sp. T9]|uniref:M28 family peptidase n=1 Tax=unclassified Nitrospira TaxID=2652172 RepID=UPI003F9D1D44
MNTSRWVVMAGTLVVVCAGGWYGMIWMPGSSYQGALPVATDEIRDLEQKLHTHVHILSMQIGERNLFHYDKLLLAAEYIRAEFKAAGYDVLRQKFDVSGKICENIEAEVRGTDRREDILVIGAHYDSVKGSPGANDNGTGISAMLALARQFAQSPVSRTLRFVAFANEEPPFFQTPSMGSWVYAQRSRQQNEHIVLMLSLETIGYYTDAPSSQRYPPPLGLIYPSTGNFIGFVSNLANRDWVQRAVGAFRQHTQFPSEGAALFEWLPGVDWSDHWAFWQEGFPALMVTDTALFRDPNYHTTNDTPDHIHFGHFARVVTGLEHVIRDLANQP